MIPTDSTTPAITLLPGEVFVTLDTDGRELRWVVTDTGLVKLQPPAQGVQP